MSETRRVKVSTPGDSKAANRYLRRVRSRYREAMEAALLIYEDESLGADEALDRIAGLLGAALKEPVAAASTRNQGGQDV